MSAFKGSVRNILLRQKEPFSCSVETIDCLEDPRALLRIEEVALITKAYKELFGGYLFLHKQKCTDKQSVYFVSINEVGELCGVAHCVKEPGYIYIAFLTTRAWEGATPSDKIKFAGTGTRLLDTVVLYARSHGYPYLKLADATHESKGNFYNNYGFTTIQVPQSNAPNTSYKYYMVPSVGDNEVEGLFHRLNDIKKPKDIVALKKYLPEDFKIKDLPIGPNPYERTTDYTFDVYHPLVQKWSYPDMKHVFFNDPSQPILYADTFPELESLTFYGNELRGRESRHSTIYFSKLKGLRIEGKISNYLNHYMFPALQTLHIGKKASVKITEEEFKGVTKLSITAQTSDPYYGTPNYDSSEVNKIFPNVIHLSLLGAFNDNLPLGLKVKHLILGPKYNIKFRPDTFVNGPVEIELSGDYLNNIYHSFDTLPFGSTVKLNGKLIYTQAKNPTKIFFKAKSTKRSRSNSKDKALKRQILKKDLKNHLSI